MQQSGCLKKRRRRNLSKVTGLGLIPYDEGTDTYTGRELFGTSDDEFLQPAGVERNIDCTRFNISVLRNLQEKSGVRKSANRPTRVLIFSDETAGQFTIENQEIRSKNVAELPSHKRQYFFNEVTVKRLKMLLILGQASGTFPWNWNETTYMIDEWNLNKQRWWHRIWCLAALQSALLTVFLVYAFFYRLEPGNYRQVFSWCICFIWYSGAVGYNLNMYFYKDDIRQYINTILHVNKKFMDQYVRNCDTYEDSGNAFMKYSIVTGITQVFITTSFFIRLPFKPWFINSYFYKPENPWYWLIPGALNEFMIAGQVITSYMIIGWIIVAHTNSTNFWLRETHNHNDDGFGSPEIRLPHNAIRIYRSLQILCQCFNDCMSPIAIPFTKVHVWMSIVAAGYGFIKILNQTFIKEFPGSLVSPFAIINCVTGGFFIISVSAEMYDLGCSFIDSWSRTKQKDFRRILISCPTLKVKVGRFYEITIGTTITFLKSALDYVVDCLLTFK